jgi:F0F1-type ATP synthase delta subunit
MRSLSPTVYGRAFIEALDGKPAGALGPALERFIARIRKNGDWPRRHQILVATEAAWRTKHGKPLLVIESARPITKAQRERIKEETGPLAHDIEERIDPGLVAGVRLILGDRELDGSLTHLLNKLFAKT